MSWIFITENDVQAEEAAQEYTDNEISLEDYYGTYYAVAEDGTPLALYLDGVDGRTIIVLYQNDLDIYSVYIDEFDSNLLLGSELLVNVITVQN